ncbi:MAG TPA: hypothetical protein VMW67_01570 [Desulfobacteria bacterium]|nr:hypothetical protein [Desulfobacteria bacterium]
MNISLDDLMGSDEEAMAVYLAILYLRFHPCYSIGLFSDSFTTPLEILTVYFSTSSPEGLDKVKNTMVKIQNKYHEELKSRHPSLYIPEEPWGCGVRTKQSKDRELWDSVYRTKENILEELEERYFKRFKEAFEVFVKVDKIPTDYRIVIKKFLQLANSRIIGEEFTSAGSAKILYNQISVVGERLRGSEGEFIDILRESRIAFRCSSQKIFDPRSYIESLTSVIIPSVAAALHEDL